MKRVLVVADDANVGIPVCDELGSSGFEVVRCWGPRPPDYVCAGARCGTCALAARADAIVVDGWLASDAARTGVPSSHLVALYRSMGLPVVALIGPNGFPGPVMDQRIALLSRDCSACDVVRSVAAVLRQEEEA